MTTPEEKITYGVITENQTDCHVWNDSYEGAISDAKFQHIRPVYIVERTEHFEIVGMVKDGEQT